jgi:hypothetical protein
MKRKKRNISDIYVFLPVQVQHCKVTQIILYVTLVVRILLLEKMSSWLCAKGAEPGIVLNCYADFHSYKHSEGKKHL